MSRLVIVESPTKARTISQFLGKDFVVESSMGHVRDLPQKYFGIDVANDFAPKYSILPKAKERVKELKEKAAKADLVILATDEDREGEAIAWHLVQALGLRKALPVRQAGQSPARPAGGAKRKASGDKRLAISDKPIQRIVFHEITKRAIDEALNNPREIDMKRVDAQQARRVLDRIVGYKLSPFLWRKIMKGLSAGRVQSVAVRLVVERERERESFAPQEYWSIEAELQQQSAKPCPSGRRGKAQSEESFLSRLTKIGETTVGKLDIKTEGETEKIVHDLTKAAWLVLSVERKESRRSPPPPFTTSTLQQEASRRLHFSAKQTMMFAQKLYEGIEIDGHATGLITYMRTDSLNLSEDFLQGTASYITGTFGAPYTSGPRRYKTTKKGAQEAHEAIRPTDGARTPESVKGNLEPKLWRLYDLIWRRAVASQMTEAVFDTTTVDTKADGKTDSYIFRANGIVMKFDGFLKIWPSKVETVTLPDLETDETLACVRVIPTQHFTEPPPRYTEATLVKTLEEYGIGRPSTYAPILSTIQGRGYVEKDEKRSLLPTDIGKQVNDLLVEHFPEIVDRNFTAKMEEDLDEIAEGKEEWIPMVKRFWDPFAEHLAQKYAEVPKVERPVELTEELCEKCGKQMVIRQSRFGKFIACSGFPECRNTKSLPAASLGIKCPTCSEGDVIERRTKKRRLFYGCSRWPACDYASWKKPTEGSPERNGGATEESSEKSKTTSKKDNDSTNEQEDDTQKQVSA